MTDLDIIKRIRAGHTGAYAELVERYQGNIYTLLCRIVTDPEKKIKTVEEIFVQAYLCVGNVSQETDYAEFLFRVTVNVLKSLWITEENKSLLSMCDRLLHLEYPQRQILLLRGIYMRTYEQIAIACGISIEDVAEHLAAAREAVLGHGCCGSYRHKMQAYIDNELMRMERMEVEAHMEECDECVGFYDAAMPMFFEPLFEEMPASVADSVTARIQEDICEENEDISRESKREMLNKKLEKNKNLYVWILVGSVLLFSAFSWLFSQTFHTRPPLDTGSDLSSDISSPTYEGDTFSLHVAQALQSANAMTVQFGVSRIGVNQKAMIMMFADYIAQQPSEEYHGTSVSHEIGSIYTQPSLPYTITITSSHHLLVDDGQTIWEIQTKRDELLNMIHKLGI